MNDLDVRGEVEGHSKVKGQGGKSDRRKDDRRDNGNKSLSLATR